MVAFLLLFPILLMYRFFLPVYWFRVFLCCNILNNNIIKRSTFIFILIFWECLSSCLYVHHVHAGACRSQKKVLDPLELGSQMVGALLWVLRMAPSALHVWAHFSSTPFQMTVRPNIWLSSSLVSAFLGYYYKLPEKSWTTEIYFSQLWSLEI